MTGGPPERATDGMLNAQHCSTPILYGDYDADDDHHGGGGGGCDDNVGYK